MPGATGIHSGLLGRGGTAPLQPGAGTGPAAKPAPSTSDLAPRSSPRSGSAPPRAAMLPTAEPSEKQVCAQMAGMFESFAAQFAQESMDQMQASMDALFKKDEEEEDDDDAEE